MSEQVLTLGQVGARLGLQVWQVRRLFERKLLPEPPRAGNYRVIPPSQLPQVEEAAREAGYLTEATTAK